MNLKFRTVIALCMVFVLLCVPCMASTCPYESAGAKTCGTESCNGSGCSSGQTPCTDESCSTCNSGSETNDVYGAFKVSNGEGTVKVCEDGSCETKTFTASNGDNSIKSWLLSLFGGSDDTQKTTSTSTNLYGNFAESESTPVAVEEEDNGTVEIDTCSSCGKSSCNNTCEKTCTTGNCSESEGLLEALRADKTEKGILSDTYTSKNFAESLCGNMTALGYDCQLVKVTFTDGKYNYLNAFKSCDGTLLVDSCGTSLGTGIKKEVTVLEIGKQWEAKSLAGTCTKVYTRGTVSEIEYL